MANGDTETHRHFILEGFTDTETYVAHRSGGGGRNVPARDRPDHAAALSGHLNEVRAAAEAAARDPEEPDDGIGIQVEFQSFPDIDLAFESLSRENQGIELRNVRHRDETTYAPIPLSSHTPNGSDMRPVSCVRWNPHEERGTVSSVPQEATLVVVVRELLMLLKT